MGKWYLSEKKIIIEDLRFSPLLIAKTCINFNHFLIRLNVSCNFNKATLRPTYNQININFATIFMAFSQNTNLNIKV